MIYSETPRTSCVLIVEERASLRNRLRSVLTNEGYDVLVARNSVEALALAADYPKPIDVLLTDMDRRRFQNGPELASCFAVLRPETTVLLSPEEKISRNALLGLVEKGCVAQLAA